MNKLDQVKIISQTDDKTVYQLNRRLLLKVVQHEGYCKVYCKVLGNHPGAYWLNDYKFIGVTVSNELSNIFDEIDQMDILSLQEFTKLHKNSKQTRACMNFEDVWLNLDEIHSTSLLLKMFDKATDVETEILSGRPYITTFTSDKDEVLMTMYIYRPLSLYELIE